MAEELDPLAADRGGRGTLGRIEEYALGVTAASVAVLGYGADLHGWCIRESTGAAAATVRIRDGRDASGAVIAPISIPSGGTSLAWFGDTGLEADTGLFLEVVGGSVEATLYVKGPGTRKQF